MKKNSDPEIRNIPFEFTDETNEGFGSGDGNEPGTPGSGGREFSDPDKGIWLTIRW